MVDGCIDISIVPTICTVLMWFAVAGNIWHEMNCNFAYLFFKSGGCCPPAVCFI
jgi:hypothetical protein